MFGSGASNNRSSLVRFGKENGKAKQKRCGWNTLLVHFLKQKRCKSVLLTRARESTPNLASSAGLNARDCEEAINKALGSYSSLSQTIGGRRALAALKDFRNIKLAHSLMGKLLKKLPTYDDLFLMVNVAREVMTSAKLAVTGVNTDFIEIEKLRRRDAEFFWNIALRAVVAADGIWPGQTRP
jgi:hypothetical protein